MTLQCSLCDMEFDGRNATVHFRDHLECAHHVHPDLLDEGVQLAIDREALGMNVRPFVCFVCGQKFLNDGTKHPADGLKSVLLFKHLIEEHGLSIEQCYDAVQDQIYPEEAAQRKDPVLSLSESPRAPR